MINFKEHKRGTYATDGSENRRSINPGEYKQMVIILLDTSSSMKRFLKDLKSGLRNLGQAVIDDDRVSGVVEFCIIAFDDEDNTRIILPFGSAYDYEVPYIDCGGLTAMHEAVDCAMEQFRIRHCQHKNEGCVDEHRPVLFILTDGKPDKPDDAAFDRLRRFPANVLPVAIGEADINFLKSISTTGKVLKATREEFSNSFNYLYQSLVSLSQSSPGERVLLPDPEDYQLSWVS